MNVKLTVEVQDFHLRYAHGDIEPSVLLQSPLASNENNDGQILVRQERGMNKNEVSYKKPDELHRLDTPPTTTYAHGILTRSTPDQDGRQGDQIWIFEAPKLTTHNKLSAVNLRTCARTTVHLDDVCWIPSMRKREVPAGCEELITIAGPPRKAKDRKFYYTAVCQLLGSGGNAAAAKLVELVQVDDTWKYENLRSSASRDGEKKTLELFRRCLSARAPAALIASTPNPSPAPARPSAAQQALSTRPTTTDGGVPTPPPDHDVPETASLTINISSKVAQHVADLMRSRERRQQAGQAPAARALTAAAAPICNLPQSCPAPGPFLFNMPSLENPQPGHHHLLDAECPIGAAHELHCVFPSAAQKGSCVLDHSYKHMCCHVNGWPFYNNNINNDDEDEEPRPPRGPGGGMAPLLSGLELDVQPMELDLGRDLDELGRRMYYYGHATEDVHDLKRQFEEAGIQETRGGSAHGQVGRSVEQEQDDTDVFADRHMIDEEDDDDDDGNYQTFG